MTNDEIIQRANEYIAQEQDAFFRSEVEALLSKKDFAELEDRFYQNLEFGTGGLRGIIAGGSNRMNTSVINKATQGLATYIIKTFPQKAQKGELKAVVAYDSRRFSDVFAQATALIFAANGFTVYLFSSLRPTPELSFAIRELSCDTGVVVTASHNPPQYNGYKAYWNDGAQVTPPHDEGIIAEVNMVSAVKTISKGDALSSGKLHVIDKEIDEKYWNMVKAQLFRPQLIASSAKDIKVVFTPLHGTGAMHVEKVLGDLGLKVITVPEQKEPNGDFPTVSYPNPEEAAALKMAIELAQKEKADVVMATDPDADRFGSAVPDQNGNYVLISGNQMGVLLTDYILLSRKELGKIPSNAGIIRSIVTTTMVDRICKAYNVHLEECLTGFKWIAAATAEFEKTGRAYIFGFEESYGYTVEKEIRDKDGVSAAAMCAEMTLYWRSKGKTLLNRLEELFTEFGYYEDRAISKTFTGSSGTQTMKNIMAKLRSDGLKMLGGKKVVQIRDVGESVCFDPHNPAKKESISLPKSNVLQFYLEDGTTVSARPSGTEPKIKFYVNCVVDVKTDVQSAKKEACVFCDKIVQEINDVLNV
ncbi:MAG: phospho-sugar mutase [Treponemataceae bacterium]